MDFAPCEKMWINRSTRCGSAGQHRINRSTRYQQVNTESTGQQHWNYRWTVKPVQATARHVDISASKSTVNMLTFKTVQSKTNMWIFQQFNSQHVPGQFQQHSHLDI
jgi:hypothetical protein